MNREIYPTEDYNITSEEAAKLLNYHVQYVRILARTGKFPALRVGGQWRFCKQEILDQLRAETEELLGQQPSETEETINRERQTPNEKRLADSSDLFQ